MKLDLDDWLGGEAWSLGLPCFPSKESLLRDLLILTHKLEDLAADLDSIRGRLEKL